MRSNYPVTDIEVTVPVDSVMVSVTDLNGTIVDVNEELMSIAGYQREELIGQNHNIMRHPDMPKAVFDDLWDTLKNGQSWRGIVKNRCKNGNYFWVDETITPVFRNGTVIGYRSRQTKPESQSIEMSQGLYAHLQDHSTKRDSI